MGDCYFVRKHFADNVRGHSNNTYAEKAYFYIPRIVCTLSANPPHLCIRTQLTFLSTKYNSNNFIEINMQAVSIETTYVKQLRNVAKIINKGVTKKL